MAQLKDLLVNGASRLIGDAFANKIQITTINAPTTSTGNTYGPGANGTVLKSNGTSTYWGTSIEYIRGTWTAASGTWIGVSTDKALYEGKQIILFMPYAGSGNATLNLTLADGTSTGAKNVYFEGTTRFTTHKEAYSQLHLIYHENHNINGTNYTGWWYIANRDTNDGQYYVRPNKVKAQTAVTSKHVIGGTASGYNNVDAGTAFDIQYDVLWAGSNITAGSADTNNYICNYAVNIQNSSNSNISFTSYKNVYIKGTISGTTFTPISGGNPYVQDITATEDGYVYYYIGRSYSSTAMSFNSTGHCIYIYKNGKVQQYIPEDRYLLKTGGTMTGTLTVPTVVGAMSKSITIGDKSYDGSDNVVINISDLGLAGSSMEFKGIITETLTDGATTSPVSLDNNTSVTPAEGNVVIDATGKEYIWSNNKWNNLGLATDFALSQHKHGNITNAGKIGATAGYAVYTTTGGTLTAGSLATSSPSANGSTTSFIDTISQDDKGKITATKKNLDTSGTWSGNAVTATSLADTPANTTTFLRGDNTWTNTLTDKLIAAGLASRDTSGNGAALQFQFSDLSNSVYAALRAERSTANGGRLYFDEYAEDENGDLTGAREAYLLPAPTQGRTSNAGFNILTSKSAVTVEQGGTGATTAAGARTNLGAVNIAGDTMTGNLVVQKAGDAYVIAKNTNTSNMVYLDAGSSTSHGIWSAGYYNGTSFTSSGKWIVYRDGAGDCYLNGTATKAVQDGDGNTITSKYVTVDTAQNITGLKTFKSLIQAYRYNAGTAFHSLPFMTFDKPGSNAAGIGPDGTNNRIHFGPCPLDGSSWVATGTFNSNDWHFQGTVSTTNALTVGMRETSTSPSSETASNRIIITPYFHTGGPWYIKSIDDSTNAYLGLYYGSDLRIKLRYDGVFTTNLQANITGNAATATKLGTSNVGNSSHPIYLNAGAPTQCASPTSGSFFQGVPAVNTDGVMEIGKYIDFHASNTDTSDYSVRLTATTTDLTSSKDLCATGLLKSTANSNTVTIGSQNASYCHIQNSANIPFYFNRTVNVDGTIQVYNTNTYMNSNDIKASRYVYCSYVNESCSAETPTTSSYWIFANSDGWLRKSSLSNLITTVSSYMTRRYGWWSSSDTHNANDLHGGATFAYASHSNTATTGTIVSFDSVSNENYGLQIQGGYSTNRLYFRNRQGDQSTWNAWQGVVHSAGYSRRVFVVTSASVPSGAVAGDIVLVKA